MSRLAKVFQRCQAEGHAALVGYLTAGDPNLNCSKELMMSLAEQVDILEIGMPFSDPMADGPVIQAASERALAAGTHIANVFRLAKEIRQSYPDLGIVLMGYANTPFVIGFESFAQQAKQAGVDAVLLVDIPPEEGQICDQIFKKHDLERILLLSPTSTQERIKLVCEHASGFIYYVSLNGITGADMGAVSDVQQKLNAIRQHTNLPICVGFGVKSPQQAADVGRFADGVVVGSHFVGQIPAYPNNRLRLEALTNTSKAMQQAMQP
ncbi:MAG: tryptophan synthase subunit alpha [Mariprofundaceae bacterium]